VIIPNYANGGTLW